MATTRTVRNSQLKVDLLINLYFSGVKISLKGNTTDGETRRVDQLEDRVFLDPVDTLVEVLPANYQQTFLTELFSVFFQPQFPEVLEFFCKHGHVHQKLVPQSRLCKCISNVSQISSWKHHPRHPSPT